MNVRKQFVFLVVCLFLASARSEEQRNLSTDEVEPKQGGIGAFFRKVATGVIGFFDPDPTREAVEPCSYTFSKFPKKEPLFLNTDLTLIEPEGSSIQLLPNEEVYLSCPGPKNALLAVPQKNLVKAKCGVANTVKIGQIEYTLDFLNCTKSISGSLKIPGSPCGNGTGVIKTIGHPVKTERFDELFQVCYNDSRGATIYSMHTLYGSSVRFAKKESSRPGFKTAGLGSNIPADVSYKKVTQKATFTTILNSSLLAEQYISNKSYLARGHLAPDADFIFVTSQFSSYFYINTVPQWQAVNNGNWKSLEFTIRNTAANVRRDLRVVTGGWGILKLKDASGIPRPIYLSTKSKKLPVPKFTWKIIKNLSSNETVGFITLNNPFVDVMNKSDILCKDVCSKYGWDMPNWKNPKKGYTYCCEVKDMRKVIPTIPDLGGIDSAPVFRADHSSVFFKMDGFGDDEDDDEDYDDLD